MNNDLNQAALDNPQVGDYWSEMFCPYFLIVNVEDDKYTVLSALGTDNARVSIDNNYWGWDYSKAMVVDKNWIEKTVKYDTIDGFVADVSRDSKTLLGMVEEWKAFKKAEIQTQIENLQLEMEKL